MNGLAYDEFIREKVYDMAIKTGSTAIKRIDKTTISNILELFQGDPLEACLTIMIYIKRQEARGEIDRYLSKQLLRDLQTIYNSFKSEPNKLENAIRKYLLLFKWAYECNVMNVNNFDDFIKKITG